MPNTKLRNLIYCLVLILFFYSYIGSADTDNLQDNRPVEIIVDRIGSDADRRNAIHSGNKSSAYTIGYDLLIDLTKVGINTDAKNIGRWLTIEQMDKIWLHMADELPAGTDFAILSSKLKEGEMALLKVSLTKNSESIDFSGLDVVTNIEPMVTGGWGLSFYGEPDYFIENEKKWTKEEGFSALENAFRDGMSEVQATVVFKEKYDIKLRNTAQYKEVMIYLQDGQDIADPYIHNYTIPVFGTKIRPDQLDYLKKHPSVANIVPDLPKQ